MEIMLTIIAVVLVIIAHNLSSGPGAITLCEKLLREHCQHCRIALGKPQQVLEPAEPPHAEARFR